jgi:hypothetical protein
MNGFHLSEGGHLAVLLPPQSISADSSAAPINPAFSMANYAHASIIIIAGAEATQDATTLILYLCATAAGGSPIAIPFNYCLQASGTAYAVAGGDVLGPISSATAAGLVLSSADWPANGVIVIEIDARELESATATFAGVLGADAYIGVGLGAPTAVDLACVLTILSGARMACVSSPSVTV